MTAAVRMDAGRRVRALAPVVLLALIAPTGAAAQARQIGDDFRTQARIRAGALYMTPTVRVDRLGVETNVFNAVEPQSDVVAAASPRLDAWIPFQRRAVLATTFIGGVEYYKTFAGERSFNPNVRSRLEVPVRRVTFSAGGDYLRTRQRPYYEIDVRARRIVREGNGGVSVELAPRLSIDLEAMRQEHRFDADASFDGTSLAETLNRDERVGAATLRWRRTVLSTFTLGTEVREARFVQSPDRDSNNLTLTAGAEFHPRALISGSGAIGVRRFTARGSAVSDITRLVARADLSYRFPTSTTATFEAERDIVYSFRRDDAFYLVSRYSLLVTQRLSPSFDVTGRVTSDAYDYQGASGRLDGVWSAEGSVGYFLSQTTRVGFRVLYVTRNSATARWRYDGIEAGLVFDYGL